ncbi:MULTISPECIES: MerR family transcriptional regulator [Thalassospira]|jgi:DNA-binding transcriptional MerR regulator|uniref:MerR family DNA-binding transcriptional regulator n=3 Tax=Thalassospira lucentensis TaxID=168935 RepID=A0A3D5NC70_9PROT|nr:MULTISPECIES: MerR family DNA-binding transcriptional regulator [Thalassospira]RCK28482.1 MerR family transcriptional regulator [Thalassospira lucentensis MCCC 1A00383 = DSM 14000]HCW68242.1 MerR family DNA-binding transcriptional regulator [Thalassospira lucentensis]|tara:strand:- start:213711 stop:214148 length:438 start_codon:yes stop_codon:yes gene_type:complete
MNDKLYSITELAEEFDITPRAIRFYETKNLLAPQRAGATRVYNYRDRARLMLVLRGKRLGFSLEDIKEYIDLYDAERSGTEQLAHLMLVGRRRISELEQQLDDVQTTLGELRKIEREAADALTQKGIDPEKALLDIRSKLAMETA